MFGHAADARPKKNSGVTYISLIKEAVTHFQEVALQFRDWSFAPDLGLDAQDLHYSVTTEAWPHGEKVKKWLDPNDEPTPTYAANHI